MFASSLLRLTSDSIFPAPVVNYWLEQLNPLWSTEQGRGRILEIHPAASDSMSLLIKLNRQARHWQPGQHVQVRTWVDGIAHSRTYSPIPVPGRRDQMMLTIRKTPGGLMSHWLTAPERQGNWMDLTPLQSGFERPHQQQPLLLLAAGSGITPLFSLIMDRLHQLNPGPITLLYWVQRHEQACFTSHMERLRARHPCFNYQIIATQTGNPQNKHLESVEDLMPHLTDPRNTQILACGPHAFTECAKKLAQQLNLPCFAESFSLPKPAQAGAPVQVFLKRSQRQVVIPSGISILSALEAIGIHPAYGCRQGVCHTCTCTRVSGITTDLLHQRMEHEADGALRLCVSTAESDLVLDL